MSDMKFKLPLVNKKPSIEKGKVTEAKLETIYPSNNVFLQQIREVTNDPSDLIVKEIPPNVVIVYIDNLVDGQTLNEHIIRDLYQKKLDSLVTIKANLSIPEVKMTN